MKLRVLDLFSGSQSVKKACALDEKFPEYEYTSLDLANSDINVDILDWNYENIHLGLLISFGLVLLARTLAVVPKP